MQEEVYGTRDRTYSAWHRRKSTRRFVGIELAQLLSMIDLDASLYVEYDDATKEPVALIETARDVGQAFKNHTVTKNLAKRTVPTLPAYVLLYTPATTKNPADPSWPDIEMFRVQRVWPRPEKSFRTLTPLEWAKALVEIRKWSTGKLDSEYPLIA